MILELDGEVQKENSASEELFLDLNRLQQAEEKKRSVEARIVEAQAHICKVFGVTECPRLVVTQSSEEYWPKVEFAVEDMAFLYDLVRGHMSVKTTCPKCGYERSGAFRIDTDKDGVRDLSDLGYELSYPDDRHDCPSDKPPHVPPVPPPPPQTVTYRHGGVEHNLLDSIREYVNDAIEQEREGR